MAGDTGGGPRAGAWEAYAAAGWAFVFAAMSFYWALGGRVGIGTQAAEIQDLVDDADFRVVVAVTGVLKVVAGMIALALVRPFGERLPRRALRSLGWLTAGVVLLYGGLGLVQAVLWEVGIHDVPATVGRDAARWKFLWEPFWVLGGVLFLLAARRYDRRVRGSGTGPGTS